MLLRSKCAKIKKSFPSYVGFPGEYVYELTSVNTRERPEMCIRKAVTSMLPKGCVCAGDIRGKLRAVCESEQPSCCSE